MQKALALRNAAQTVVNNGQAITYEAVLETLLTERIKTNVPRRPLTMSDLVKDKEFTLAQCASVDRGGGTFDLKAGVVIKIYSASESGFEISVDGHSKDLTLNNFFVPINEVSDFIIVDEA